MRAQKEERREFEIGARRWGEGKVKGERGRDLLLSVRMK